jgi:predicted permease
MIWPHFREWVLRLRKLGGRKRLDQDLEDELAFHIAMREEKKISAGLNPKAAQMEARREFGGIEKWKEALRDVRRPRVIENFFADVSLALRLLRKSPAFTLVALGTLTLAIGANAAVFTLLNTLLLKPLPVPEADRLTVWRVQPLHRADHFNYASFRGLEAHSAAFSDVFAFYQRQLQLRTGEGTVNIPGMLVSGHYFSTLRVPPEKGRWIGPMDDQPNGGKNGPAIVISDQFWKTHFDGDAHVIGRGVTLDHVSFTVVGVMPPGFFGAEVGRKPDVYVPLALEPQIDAPFNLIAMGWRAWWLHVGARLRDGVSLAQANAMLHVRSKNIFMAAIPDPNWSIENVKRDNLYAAALAGATGFSDLRTIFRKPLLIVLVLVALVLCVACMNLASLLMARSAARARELATRSALGAGRGRLIQQLLTESLLLAGTGTVIGFAISFVVSRALVSFLTRADDPLSFDIAPDIRVFAFVAAAAALSTVLVGIVPALRATGRRLQQGIKEGQISLVAAERRHLWARVLMGTEIALASVLVTGAGLLGYSLILLHDAPLGFQPHGLMTLALEMNKQPRDGKALLQFYQEFATELLQVHGVKNVSYSLGPMSDNMVANGAPPRHLRVSYVGSRYFSTMGIPRLGGREFRWQDTDETGQKAILNQSAAALLFPGGHAIGQQFISVDKRPIEVVGIVADAKQYSMVRAPAPPMVYRPMSQHMMPRASFTMIVRDSGNSASVLAAVRTILRQLAPEVPVPGAIPMETEIAQSLRTERLMATLASFFAISALLIMAVGLYGTLAYSTARRTGEIGVRMALGGQRANILRLILSENSLILLGGCVFGLLLSLACARLLASFLFDVKPGSPMVLGISAGVLIVAGLLASLPPALRATRIDPIQAIRHE